MFGLKRVLLVGLCVLGLNGCSEPEPVTIDIDDAAKNAGLTPDDYEVSDNGTIRIKAPNELEAEESATVASNQPVAVQGDNWKYVISNALMVADANAVANNPSATYLPQNSDINLIKQVGGQYEGEYLLTVINDNQGDISYVQLRPLFDVNESSDLLEKQLDDETPLWEVTVAKFNGQEF